MAYSSAYAPSHSTVPPPSAPGISGILPGQQAVNTTRVLSLTGFSKDLKTRDIQAIFVEYEDDRGGYRIKWLDDTGCLIVFNDPLVAKRAFLHLTANPHPHLMPVISTEEGVASTFPKLTPYNGDDVVNVVASVANRPRSRSIAQNNAGTNNGNSTSNTSATVSPASNASAHHRRMSNSSGGGNVGGMNGGGSRSFGRASMSQYQMQAIMDEARSAVTPTTPASSNNKDAQVNGTGPGSASPPSPTNKENSPSSSTAAGGAIDWTALQQQAAAQQQVQAQVNRNRTGSGSNQVQHLPGGQAFSPPTSPERSLGLGNRAGAASPSALRRLVSANRG